jgi:hypothetical protein
MTYNPRSVLEATVNRLTDGGRVNVITEQPATIALELCENCYYLAANGADENIPDVPWPGIDEGWIVIPGHPHTLDECGEGVMDGTADCPFDEASFSWSPCDACRRPLGGDRYPASMVAL